MMCSLESVLQFNVQLSVSLTVLQATITWLCAVLSLVLWTVSSASPSVPVNTPVMPSQPICHCSTPTNTSLTDLWTLRPTTITSAMLSSAMTVSLKECVRGWGLGWLFGTVVARQFLLHWRVSGGWLNLANSTQSVFITAACSA